MKKTNWDNFRTDEEMLDHIKRLPRYKNSSLKSVFRRAVFFFQLLICRIFNLDRPLFVVLVTNNRCNLDCKYCYGDYGKRGGDGDYSTGELLKIIDELKDMGTQLITLHGGEALLRKDIGEIVNYIKLKGFCLSFNTNGYFVPLKIKDLECVDTMILSLDGSREVNDKNRGAGCFDRVMEAIEVVLKRNIPCVISATLTKDNMRDMGFLAKLGLSKNIRIQYSILYNSPFLKKEGADVVMSDADIRRTVKNILDLKKKGFPIYYSDNVLAATINWPFSHDEKRYLVDGDEKIVGNFRPISCYHGSLKYQIDADGRVITCWAHDDLDAPNLRELGLAAAMKKCRENNECRYCAFLANNEHNALMQLGRENIWNILRIQIVDVFKIKKRP